MIRPISFREILDAPNAPELLARYAAESSIPELGPTNPQASMYEAMEKAGTMQAFGVYRGGLLTGFATILIYILPHYGVKIAATESIFLAKEFRSSGDGLRLLDFIEEYAKEQGCVGILETAPTDSAFEKLLSLRKDCRRTNSVFLRKL